MPKALGINRVAWTGRRDSSGTVWAGSAPDRTVS
jgi:hypothetical protein